MIEFVFSEAIFVNALILSPYLILLILKFTAARFKVFAAVFLCIVISHTPLYLIMDNIHRYSFLSIVYIIACRNITNKKVSATCCIMAIFELSMVIDRYVNAGVETWLYIYFEEITLIIHSLIISAFFKWEFNWRRGAVGSAVDYMRKLLRNMRYASRLCYDYIINQKRQIE